MTDKRPSADKNTENLPELLPIMPLHETALFPKMVLPLVVMQSESVKLVDEAMSKNRIIGLLVSRPTEEGDGAESGTAAYATSTQPVRAASFEAAGSRRLVLQGWVSWVPGGFAARQAGSRISGSR